MNIVIYSDKKVQRYFTANMDLRPKNITVLGYENEVRLNFVKRVTEYYNPHILVIFDGVKVQKGIDLFESVFELHNQFPNLRIIYLYGNIDDEARFLDISSKLIQCGIYDIMTVSLYTQGFRKQFTELLDKPMTKNDFEESIKKKEDENKTVSETLKTEIQKIIDQTPVTFAKNEICSKFETDTVNTVDEPQEQISKDKISIGISCVTYNSGVIQTAFEIAIMLQQAKNSVALFLNNDLYRRYIDFHNIKSASDGFTVNGLDIYPYDKSDEEAVHYGYCIYELSEIHTDEQQLSKFEKSDIKISLCTGTEWDIIYLEEYLNLPLPYLKDINYCFYPISQADFIKYNKQMIKGHCKAYRLRTSPHYTNPCQFNRDVYTEILNRYKNVNTVKKSLFGMR